MTILKARKKTALTGGTETALDGIDGDLLNDGDFAFVMLSGIVYVYELDADSGAAESSPSVISPDSNAGTKRWILQSPPSASMSAGIVELATDMGLLPFGTAGQVLRVNSGASALEYGTVSSTVPIGHLSGLTVSRKDNDEIYVSGGSIEMGGVLYNSDEQLTVSGGSLAETYGSTNLVVASSVSGGDYSTFTAGNLSDGNTTTPTGEEAVIWSTPVVVDFGSNKVVGKIRFFVGTQNANAKVEYSTNGSEYTTIDTYAVSAETWKEITGEWTARYIRFAYGSGGNLYLREAQIYELINKNAAMYVYVDPPASGTELAAENLIISATAPSFDSAKGGFYHPTNTDQRAIAHFTTDASGHVPTAPFVHYQPLPAVSSGAQLLSVTNLPLNADGETTIYTVPAGVRCVLSYAILVAGADAGSTDLTIGADGAETDWLGTQQLDNLDAEHDAVMLMPVPNATPVKIKSYAAGTVLKAVVANHAGGATNTLYLYGMLY